MKMSKLRDFFETNKIQLAILAVAFAVGAVSFLFERQRNNASVRPSVAFTASTVEPRATSGLAGGAAVAGSSACVSIADAVNYVGRNQCITGTVLRVYVSQAGTTFLDFCKNYKTCPFSSVIFASDQNSFPNISEANGRMVELYGTVGTYQGRPQIILKKPEQIKIIR